MANLLTPRRTESDITLHASESTPSPSNRRPTGPGERGRDTTPPIGWLLVAIAGGLVAVVASWILNAGVAVIGWLAADPGTLGDALRVGTRFWLLGNGVSAPIGSLPVTLVPWGAAAISAFMLYRFAAVAARHLRDGQAAGPGVVSVVTTVAYLLPVVVVAVFEGEPWRAPGHWAVVVAVLIGSAYAGGARTMGTNWTDSLPAWLRPVPRAVLGAQLALLAGGAAVLLTGLLINLERVGSLQEALDTGITGGIALLIAQWAVTPNALAWAASYALGAGFTLGNGSVIAPAGSDLGMLPGLPLLGGLPGAGPGGADQIWWLVIGVLAGATAAWIVVRSRPKARFDETSLVGGLAGLLSGVAFVGVAWATSGDLGAVRLADLGPRLLPLLVMSGTTLGLAGMITGLLLGLLRGISLPRLRPAPAEPKAQASDPELTKPITRAKKPVRVRDEDREETVVLSEDDEEPSSNSSR